MGFFSKKQNVSSSIAKERLKLLLISDRICCSPQTMQMLKNDLIKTVAKYIPIDAENVSISFQHSPQMLSASIPLKTGSSVFEKTNIEESFKRKN